LSVPTPRRPRRLAGRWEVIGSALDSWQRTLRLCLILLVSVIPPAAAAVVVELIRHMLLCGSDRNTPETGNRQAEPLVSGLRGGC
jgi:hypothetical protein